MNRLPLVLGAALLAACASGDTDTVTDSAAAASGTPAAAAPATADSDIVTQGGGVPAGYVGQVDPPGPGAQPADIAQASYAMRDGHWEVRTGPAHIVYAADDTGSGAYTASTTIEQLEAPGHPEAFGLFIGGMNLGQPSQSYTYFIVRHTGEYMVRVRESERTRTVIDWTASPAVPKSGAGGKATYHVALRVAADSVRFLVNDRPVATLGKGGVPTNGVAGVRINHNLHVLVQPLRIARS